MSDVLVQFSNQLESALRAMFPTDLVKNVKKHAGKFSKREIEVYATKAPAIVITFSAIRPATNIGGSTKCEVVVNLFIITKTASTKDRDEHQLLIQGRLMQRLPTLNLESAANPVGVKSENLYDGDLDDQVLCLWGTAWTQNVEIPGMTDEEYDNLDDFRRIWNLYSMIPSGGTDEDPPAVGTEAMNETSGIDASHPDGWEP